MNRDEFLKATCVTEPELSDPTTTEYKLVGNDDKSKFEEKEVLSFYETKHVQVCWELDTENKTEMDSFFEMCIVPALFQLKDVTKKYLNEGYETYIPDSHFTIGFFKPSLNTKMFTSEKGFCWKYSEAYNISNEGQGADTYGDGALLAKIDIRLRRETKNEKVP